MGNPPGTDNYEKYMVFVDNLAEVSGGLLTIEVFAGGVLASDAEALDALLNGSVDFVHLHAGTAVQAVKDVAIMSLFGTFKYKDDNDLTSFVDFEHALHDTFEDIYADYGIKYLRLAQANQAVLVCRDMQIKSPADMKNKLWRTSGSYQGRVIEAWGAAATNVSMADLPSSLERGTVEGTITAYGASASFKLYEVAPYTTYTQYTDGISSLAMSMDSWNSLTPQEQDWVQEAAEYYLINAQGVGKEWYDRIMKELTDYGTNIYELTNDEHQAFLDLVDPIKAEVYGECSDKGKKLMDQIEAWQKANR